MKRTLFLQIIILSVAFCPAIFSQANSSMNYFKGQTLNQKDSTSVPYVNIYYKSSQTGTSSDSKGNFIFQFDKNRISDTLVFSSIGYKTRKISLTEVFKSDNYKFYLEEDIIALDEITISTLPAVKIIEQAMNKRQDIYWISPHKLSGIFRIADRENGAYVRLLEAAIDIYDADYLDKNSRKVDYLALRQSKDFRTFKWKVTKNNARNVEELLQPDLIKRPTRASHPNGFEKGFFYRFEDYTVFDNETVYVISATKNTAYQWPNYDATFYVRAKDLAILRVDRDYNIGRVNWMKAPNVRTEISSDKLVLIYKETQGKLHLDYFSWSLKGEVIDIRNNQKIEHFERIEEIDIHQISFEKRKKIRVAWDEDIYKMTEPYDEAFWAKYPTSNTQLFEDVSKELKKIEGLNQQFQTSQNSYKIYAPQKQYRPKELKEDFLLLKRSLEEAHPSLYRYSTEKELTQLFKNSYKKLNKGMSEIKYYKLITALIAKINCGHTQSFLSEDYYNHYNNREFFFPIQTQFVNGKLLISENEKNDNEISQGDQILSIDDIPITQIKESIYPHLLSDGHIETFKNKIFAAYFPFFYSIHFGFKDQFAIKIKKPNDKEIETNVRGISYANYLTRRKERDEENTYSLLTPDIAYLKIKSFSDGKTLQFKKWVKEIFNELSQTKVDNLIIDLRDNSGGRDDYALYFYSFITSEHFYYHTSLEAATNTFSFLEYTDQKDSFNELMNKIVVKDSTGRFILNDTHPTLGVHKGNADTFNPKIFFLINGNTFSAAADLASIASQNKLGLFVGEETGGTTMGNTSNGELTLTLPNTGIRVKIPLFKITNAVDTDLDGRGVIPDFPITYDRSDFIKKVDQELNFVLNYIKEKQH